MDAETRLLLGRLIRGERIAHLATLRDGAPMVSMTLYMPEQDFSAFYVHVSRLAWHTQDMQHDGRAALKSDQARNTVLTNVFTGRPARGIVNRVIRELGPMSDVAPAFPLAATALAPLRAKAEAKGSGDFSPLWSGQNATGCREIPAGELTQALAEGL